MSRTSPPFFTRRDLLLAAGVAAAALPLVARLARAATSAPAAPLSAMLDVRSCGATGNGRTLDTAAINAAIQRVSASGGGTIRFPAGDYLCHTLHLRDGVILHLEHAATLRAAPAGEYDDAQPNPWDRYQDYGHNHWHNSLICGIGVKDVAITGPGVIDGNGLSRGDWTPTRGQGHEADKIIALKECQNVTLDGFSLIGSPHIGILATGVGNLRVSRLLVDVIRDGIDIDCCNDVVVEDSAFNTPNDDSIVLKSSDALGYRQPTRNVVIRRCVVTGGFRHGTLFDGTRVPISAADGMKARIKIGTESCWGFADIRIEDCAVSNALGIPLLTVDGGALQNVVLRNIVLRNIQDSPLFLRLGQRLRAPDAPTVQPFAGVTVENFACDGFRMPVMISGIPDHRIADVTLRNIDLVQRPLAAGDAGGGWMPLAATAIASTTTPPENASDYPEVGMFGPLPAKLFFARHVDGLAIDGLRLKTADTAHAMPATATTSAAVDQRPLFWLQDVRGGTFAGVSVPHDAAQKLCLSDSACSLADTVSATAARPG